MLSLSAAASVSICEFFLHYPHKTSCLVKRIKQMIINSNFIKTINKILPTFLQGCYGDNLEEFSNTSYGVFEAERITFLLYIVRLQETPKLEYQIGKSMAIKSI